MESRIPQKDHNRFVLTTAFRVQKGAFPWKWDVQPPWLTLTKVAAQVYPEPDTGARPLGLLGIRQPVVVLAQQNGWVNIGQNRWILQNHLDDPLRSPKLMPAKIGLPFEILWLEDRTLAYDAFDRELRSRRLQKEVHIERADSIEDALSRLTQKPYTAIISRRSSQQDAWMGINLCYILRLAGSDLPVAVYTQERAYPELHTELQEAGGVGVIAGVKAMVEWVIHRRDKL